MAALARAEALGGQRWWFICPVKKIRVGKLYRFVGTALGAAMGALLTAYAQNVAAFGAGVFVLGLICALLCIGRNAFRYAGITLAIVMLVARAEPAWMIGIHRFLEISVGIAVGLLLTAVWPEPEPAAA